MFKTLTENPVPATMLGLGVIWLLTKSEESPGKRRREGASRSFIHDVTQDFSQDSPMDQACRNEGSLVQEQAPEWMGQTSGQGAEWSERVQDQAQEWKEQAGHQARQLKAQAQQRVQQFKEETDQRIDEVKRYLHQQAASARDGFHHVVERNPLAVGAVTIAVGAAVAALLPGTRKENEWMGDSRANLSNAMKATVQTAVEDATSEVQKSDS